MTSFSTVVFTLVALLDCGRACHAWTPQVGDSWNYNLNTPVVTTIDVDVFFIDMDNAQDTIDELHENGKAVVCYISIGSVEAWRDDAADFPAEAIGNDMDGWEGEKWLDVNNLEVRAIMTARVENAATMNCDAIEPDNMMVYTEPDTGIDVSRREQIQYNIWFAATVHANGMKVGLKNSIGLVQRLASFFDFAINEECYEWSECDAYVDTFLAAGKPVFNVEYLDNLDMCDAANDIGMDTIVKKLELNAPMCSCADPSRNYMCESDVL